MDPVILSKEQTKNEQRSRPHKIMVKVKMNNITNNYKRLLGGHHHVYILSIAVLIAGMVSVTYHVMTMSSSAEDLYHKNQYSLSLGHPSELELGKIESNFEPYELPDDLSIWDNCEINALCQRRGRAKDESEKPKPVWLSGYPASGDEILRPFMIDTLFDQGAAAKNFYTKKCPIPSNDAVTATCSQIHPITGLNPLPNDPVRAVKFNKNVILLLRNPAIVAAAHYQYKANQYHHVKGQVPIEDWRKFRDAVTETGDSLKWWLDVLDTWRSYAPQPLNISLYVQYEKLFHFKYGPKILQQLIQTFEQAGFANYNLPIIDDTNSSDTDSNRNKTGISCLECIWYKSVRKERLIQYHQYKYEFSDYMPGYTKPQREFWIQQLQLLIEKYENDTALLPIMYEYLSDVKSNLQVDE